MLNHQFTTREKILILVCSIIALAIFYYQFAFSGFQSQLAQYDTTDLQDQVMIEETRAMNLNQMKQDIASASGESFGEIAVYNNQSNEIQALNDILSGRATAISITWNQPTLTDLTVRRDASISFSATSYATVREILTDLSNCKYRLIINDVSLNTRDTSTSLTESASINASVTVTFFETADGAATTQGLIVLDNNSAAASAEPTE